jgi:hypothetical protein
MALKFWDKKGLEFLANWALIIFIAMLVLSFFLSYVVAVAMVNYGIVFFMGIILGYVIHSNKYGNRFPYYCVAFGIALGYTLGLREGSRIVLLVVFLASIILTKKLRELIE